MNGVELNLNLKCQALRAPDFVCIQGTTKQPKKMRSYVFALECAH